MKKYSHYLDINYIKKGWTQKEYDWLMWTLKGLSLEELNNLYRIVYPKGWQEQKDAGFPQKGLSKEFAAGNFITFLICSFESIEKGKVKKIVKDFVKKLS